MSLVRSYAVSWLIWVCALAACGHSGGGATGDAAPAPDACQGLGCQIVDCAAQGKPPTTLSGTVMAPNGTLPLYGVTVYVPASDPGPLTAGVTCDPCGASLAGGAIVQTVTDERGQFVLTDVPAVAGLPLVVQVGKWRRQLTVPTVSACQDTPLPTTATALPRSRAQGDLPRIAITTGNADALECLVRKLGVDDAEITTDSGAGAVHLYAGNGASKFATGFAGGAGTFASATTLWSNLAKLSAYDLALFSCEGAQHPETKPLSSLQVVRDFADRGGRVFLSHWHNIWIAGNQADPTWAIPEWKSIATFDFAAAQNEATQLTIVDETSSKGVPFATWLQNVGASVHRDEIEVSEPRYTCQAVDPAKGERWVYVDPARSTPLGKTGVQDMLFTTPQTQPADARCGKVVYSDMHVSSGSTSKTTVAYPGGCSTAAMSPQEKALAFIFFDIASCVGVIQ
jgi:hypothetical protein